MGTSRDSNCSTARWCHSLPVRPRYQVNVALANAMLITTLIFRPLVLLWLFQR